MFNRMRMVVPAVLLATTVFGGFALTRGRAAAVNKVVPAPAVDETPAASGSETLTLAGGCFWGVQGVFQHVKGVEQAVSGYDGGSAKTADYETVSTGTTGHAESVRITYDPHVITYGRLLQIFFSVATDPTQVNEQYPDVGTQYPFGDFREHAGAGEDRAGVYRSVGSGACLSQTDRDAGRAGFQDSILRKVTIRTI